MTAPVSGPKMQTTGPVDRSDILLNTYLRSLPTGLAAGANPLIYNLIGGKIRDSYLTDEIVRGAQNRYVDDLITKSKAVIDLADQARATPTNQTLAQTYSNAADNLKLLTRTNPITDAVQKLSQATTAEARASAKVALEQAAGDTAYRAASSAADKSLIQARASTARWAGILATTATLGLSAHENYSAYNTGLKSGGRASADFVTDMGLAYAGATIGAQLGTALLPGAGTLTGAVAGGFLGFSVAYFGGAARDGLFDEIGFY